ncbi:hypothetical protein CYFUS_007030 [Cystobacter fuscus]|uniref:Uncharacterized protein n=1 Tax=Cystobacter fuscus TaxID=43 RepID=A0A250JCC6_9BACT|nr:hypothetical protein CYFUS_007030 [Cystobacter fuscus]
MGRFSNPMNDTLHSLQTTHTNQSSDHNCSRQSWLTKRTNNLLPQQIKVRTTEQEGGIHDGNETVHNMRV